MATSAPPGSTVCFSRSELEIELARMALWLMRAAPHAFALYGVCNSPAPSSRPSVAAFQAAATQLLARTSDRDRRFVSTRLRELARSCAGLHFEGFDEWLASSEQKTLERRHRPREATEQLQTRGR